jgi:hypothetical protein
MPEHAWRTRVIFAVRNLKAEQLSGSIDAIRIIQKDEPDLLPTVIDAIEDDAVMAPDLCYQTAAASRPGKRRQGID